MNNNPFENKDFINYMENILIQCNENVDILLNAMGEINKELHPEAYYTLDCALCYYTFKKINKKYFFSQEIKNLQSRVNKNIEIINNN